MATGDGGGPGGVARGDRAGLPGTLRGEGLALAWQAGAEVLDMLYQKRDKPDPGTYIGSGKVAELREIVQATGADTVICDGELAPSQLRNLEDRVKVKVVDRVALILDIFAQHAKSKEGKAQVELAQLQYLLPRLRGWGESMSRQAGGQAAGGQGMGSRGPGETKIELDRRRIRTGIVSPATRLHCKGLLLVAVVSTPIRTNATDGLHMVKATRPSLKLGTRFGANRRSR